MEKICSKCGVMKPFVDFNKAKKYKDGLRTECRCCQKLNYTKNREYYIAKMKANRDIKKDEYTRRDKEYYLKNKDKIIESKKEYYLGNSENILKKAALYRLNNKDKRAATHKKWVEENIEHVRNYRNNYAQNYRKQYPHIIRWRSILNSSLKRLGTEKKDKTILLLGYSAEELKRHLEANFTEGMNWENSGLWHIDHVKPVTSFDENTPSHIVNALSNLTPLWASDNIRKGNNVT